MSHPSQARIEASRRNTKRSSQNAVRHGLTGRIVVLPTEDMEVYTAFSKELVDSLNPETPMERQLAQTVADSQWRLNRARTWEDGMLALGQSPEIHPALSDAKVFRDRSKDFVNLSLYEQRIQRARKNAFDQLRELQAERKSEEMCDPGGKLKHTLSRDNLTSPSAPVVKAASVLPKTMTAEQATPFSTNTSKQNGFVYSNDQASGFVCSDSEYDPGAFDPIYFKNSIPVKFIEIPRPTTEKKAA